MALLADLGFSLDTLEKRRKALHFFRGFDAAVEEMLPDSRRGCSGMCRVNFTDTCRHGMDIPIFDDTNISEGDYRWKGQAEVGGKTVHIRLRACNQAHPVASSRDGCQGRHSTFSAKRVTDILVRRSLDEEGFSALYWGGEWFDFSNEAGFQTFSDEASLASFAV